LRSAPATQPIHSSTLRRISSGTSPQWLPDGRRVAFETLNRRQDRTDVYLMDRPKNMKIADDTTLIRKLERQNGAITTLAWSPDGRRIAVGGASPEVNLYDADTGVRVAACKGHAAGIYTVAFSPDGAILAAGGFDGSVRLYDASTGELKKSFVPVPLDKAVNEVGGLR
jgi:WD40 repeat protein